MRGLDLVLAGGIRAVEKVPGRTSAVVLVRGPAGAGKTLFASHLAMSEASARGGDVVYGCVELLPRELAAQLSNLTFGPGRVAARIVDAGQAPAPNDDAPRIFASMIEIPSTGEPDFGEELQRALSTAREAGGSPSVVVIDSLAEGYRIGGTVSRELADGLAKFAAEEGVVLILIEEVLDHQDSLWTFVADVVLELAHHGAVGTAAAERRSLLVHKSRYGPSHFGPHGFTIRRDGAVEVYPRPSTYLAHWARDYLPRQIRKGAPARWRATFEGAEDHAAGGDDVVMVTGVDPFAVAVTVQGLSNGVPTLGLDLTRVGPDDDRILSCGDPTLGAEFLLSTFYRELEAHRHRVAAVVIGDLAAIDANVDPAGLRRALPVLIAIAQEAGLSVMLYETTALHAHPAAGYLADTVFTGKPTNVGVRVMASSRRGGFMDALVEVPGLDQLKR